MRLVDGSRPEAGAELGRYVLVRLLGAGGQGQVWLARHRELGSLHAIKILGDGRAGVVERLRQEGRLQAATSHPNIVRVTDTVEVDGHPALVMEYVDGPTLGALLEGRRPDVAELDAIGLGILRGAAHAHDRGWVHRDLKPANILLSAEDGVLVPKIADFGLAKVLDEADPQGTAIGTPTRQGVGTPRFMSMEQVAGLRPDPRMDVFALGAVLFELLTGRPAFPTAEDWATAIQRDQYPDVDEAAAPARMCAAVRAALQPVALRPATARELLDLWTGVEAGSLSASTGATAVRPRRWGVLVALVVGALLGLGGLGAPWLRAEPAPAPPPAPSPAAPAPPLAPPEAAPPARSVVEGSVPTAPAPPPRKVRANGRIVVTGMLGGEAGTFRVDEGERRTVGAKRAVTVPAGEHHLEVFAADGALVDERTVDVLPNRDFLLCWDLAAHQPCEPPKYRAMPTP